MLGTKGGAPARIISVVIICLIILFFVTQEPGCVFEVGKHKEQLVR